MILKGQGSGGHVTTVAHMEQNQRTSSTTRHAHPVKQKDGRSFTESKMSDVKFYIQELRSEECACGRSKRSRYSFCYTCYQLLPDDMQRDLWNYMGDGYEEAYDAAVAWLKEDGRIE